MLAPEILLTIPCISLSPTGTSSNVPVAAGSLRIRLSALPWWLRWPSIENRRVIAHLASPGRHFSTPDRLQENFPQG